MIEAFREWAATVNTVLLFGLVIHLMRGQQRMAEGKVRIAKGSEDRAKVALSAILGVCDDIKAQLGDSGFHPAVHDELPERPKP